MYVIKSGAVLQYGIHTPHKVTDAYKISKLIIVVHAQTLCRQVHKKHLIQIFSGKTIASSNGMEVVFSAKHTGAVDSSQLH
jgi:hypothetical protein